MEEDSYGIDVIKQQEGPETKQGTTEEVDRCSEQKLALEEIRGEDAEEGVHFGD